MEGPHIIHYGDDLVLVDDQKTQLKRFIKAVSIISIPLSIAKTQSLGQKDSSVKIISISQEAH